MEPENQLLPIEDMARTYKHPISLLRLAVDCGCPTHNGLMRFSEFVLWFTDNYALIRAKAGLSELPSTEGLTKQAAARIEIGNSLLTLAEYLESRSSDEEIKEAAKETSAFILQIMDRKKE